MTLQTVCFLGIGFWIFIAFIGITAVVIAGKSDEELGYKWPVEQLITEEEGFEKHPSVTAPRSYDPAQSEQAST